MEHTGGPEQGRPGSRLRGTFHGLRRTRGEGKAAGLGLRGAGPTRDHMHGPPSHTLDGERPWPPLEGPGTGLARRLVTEPPARWPEAVTRPNPGPGTAWWPASAKAPPPGTSPPVGEAGGAAGGGSGPCRGPRRGPRAPEASGCWPKPTRLWPVFPAPTKVAPGGAELKPQGVDGRGSSVTPEPNAPLLLGGNLVLAGLPPGQGSHTLPRSKSPGGFLPRDPWPRPSVTTPPGRPGVVPVSPALTPVATASREVFPARLTPSSESFLQGRP